MCLLFLKILVIICLFDFSVGDRSSEEINFRSSKFDNSMSKETTNPIDVWTSNDCYMRLNNVTGWEYKLQVLHEDVIELTVIQNFVPKDFIYYQVKRVHYIGNVESESYVSITEKYENCNSPERVCIYSTKILNCDDDITHKLIINFGSLAEKKIYNITRSKENRKPVTHKVTYIINWKTGCDYFSVNTTDHSTITKRPDPETTWTLRTPAIQDFPVSSAAPPLNQKPNDEGKLSAPVISGIVALVVIIILLALWMFWKFINKRKTEPIYHEIQYADLLLNNTNRSPPQPDNIPYSQIQGVLVPKPNSDVSPTNETQDNLAYAEIKEILDPDKILNNEGIVSTNLTHNDMPYSELLDRNPRQQIPNKSLGRR